MRALLIRPITVEDTANIVTWRNSAFVSRNVFTQSELTREQHLRWLNECVFSGKCWQFIIEAELNDTMTPIGTTFIKNIDRYAGTGEFGIFIGEMLAVGKGYGF